MKQLLSDFKNSMTSTTTKCTILKGKSIVIYMFETKQFSDAPKRNILNIIKNNFKLFLLH